MQTTQKVNHEALKHLNLMKSFYKGTVCTKLEDKTKILIKKLSTDPTQVTEGLKRTLMAVKHWINTAQSNLSDLKENLPGPLEGQNPGQEHIVSFIGYLAVINRILQDAYAAYLQKDIKLKSILKSCLFKSCNSPEHFSSDFRAIYDKNKQVDEPLKDKLLLCLECCKLLLEKLDLIKTVLKFESEESQTKCADFRSRLNALATALQSDINTNVSNKNKTPASNVPNKINEKKSLKEGETSVTEQEDATTKPGERSEAANQRPSTNLQSVDLDYVGNFTEMIRDCACNIL